MYNSREIVLIPKLLLLMSKTVLPRNHKKIIEYDDYEGQIQIEIDFDIEAFILLGLDFRPPYHNR